MNIDKASEILTAYHQYLPRGINDDYFDAIGLAIEALKFIHENRDYGAGHIPKLLPGETED